MNRNDCVLINENLNILMVLFTLAITNILYFCIIFSCKEPPNSVMGDVCGDSFIKISNDVDVNLIKSYY